MIVKMMVSALFKPSVCQCNKYCHLKFLAGDIEQHRQQRAQTQFEDRENELFLKVRDQVLTDDGKASPHVAWQLFGAHVCKPLWCHANMTGHATVDNMKKLIAAGHSTMPPHAPRMPHERSKNKIWQADAWFFHLYQDLAEPLANVLDDINIDQDEDHIILDDGTHPLWHNALPLNNNALCKPQRSIPKRYLNPGTLESLSDL